MKELTKYNDQIRHLCTLYSVKALFAFGSAVNGKLKTESDIDLVVDIDDKDPLSYSDKYFALKFRLEELLHRRVDLLEQKSIRNPYLKKNIDRTKVQLYGG